MTPDFAKALVVAGGGGGQGGYGGGYNAAATDNGCTATNAGGTMTESFTVQRDATPPTIAVTGPPLRGSCIDRAGNVAHQVVTIKHVNEKHADTGKR